VQFYPSGTRFPNGESLGEAQMRIVQAIDGLRAQHPKQIIAVFSHADLIKLAIAYYIGMHIDLFQRLTINPCSLTALAFERMGPRLLAFNDTGSIAHLWPRPEEPAADQPAKPDEGQAPAEPGFDGTDGAQPPEETAAILPVREKPE
jgi:probable phosphoglycerate mutase